MNNEKFQPAEELVRDLCLFLQSIKREWHADAKIEKMVFGISGAVVSVRAFLDKWEVTDLEPLTDELYDALRARGLKNLYAKSFSGTEKFSASYVVDDKTGRMEKSVSIGKDTTRAGLLLRGEMAKGGDERPDIRDAVLSLEPLLRSLLDGLPLSTITLYLNSNRIIID